MSANKMWQPREDALVEQHYADGTPAITALAEVTGRTRNAIQHRALVLGVPRVRQQYIPQPGSFGHRLKVALEHAGISQSELGRRAGINPSYVNRLAGGDRTPPTREVVIALARGLELDTRATDALLHVAGHLPLTLQALGPDDSTVAALVAVLTNNRISPEVRANFRAVVEVVASQFGKLPK